MTLRQPTTAIPAANHSLEEKEKHLRAMMRQWKRVLVAYSGGVDSALVALIATEELGENALCVTGLSPSVSEIQKRTAADIAEKFNFNYLTIDTEELEDPNYRANSKNRCYFCKTELYGKLSAFAAEKRIEYVVDGSNADDEKDYRPGRQAAAEFSVRSPLADALLTKAEIRELSKKYHLPTWDQPSSPCLSSRIAYGIPVSIERLGKVERGEAILRAHGFKEFRVRYHGELVRLEIAPPEMEYILRQDLMAQIANAFKAIGFSYITLDMQGYRSGAMNEILDKSREL